MFHLKISNQNRDKKSVRKGLGRIDKLNAILRGAGSVLCFQPTELEVVQRRLDKILAPAERRDTSIHGIAALVNKRANRILRRIVGKEEYLNLLQERRQNLLTDIKATSIHSGMGEDSPKP